MWVGFVRSPRNLKAKGECSFFQKCDLGQALVAAYAVNAPPCHRIARRIQTADRGCASRRRKCKLVSDSQRFAMRTRDAQTVSAPNVSVHTCKRVRFKLRAIHAVQQDLNRRRWRGWRRWRRWRRWWRWRRWRRWRRRGQKTVAMLVLVVPSDIIARLITT